ncbi:MAG TPA: hypothetical protein VEW28_08510 [Candidatus Kapabacteria bacterium]|nr:hypothetical protein [Candidatus Kapabacteria bacterium]
MKKLTIETNTHLNDRDKRRAAIVHSVIASSRIEGILLTKAQEEAIARRVDKRLKKDSE